MAGSFAFRVICLLAGAALAGCGIDDTALRNSNQLPQDTQTLHSEFSSMFRDEVKIYVNFDFDSDDLDRQAHATVRKQANWIKKYPFVQFSVTGHTDKVGNEAYNMDLGLRRANAVVDALVALGVDRGQLIAKVSQGETTPLINTEDRERMNRRTITEVLGFIEPTATGSITPDVSDHGPDGERETFTTDDDDEGSDDEGPDGDDGPNKPQASGNPGNHKNVGRAGETPNGGIGWGNGDKGKSK